MEKIPTFDQLPQTYYDVNHNILEICFGYAKRPVNEEQKEIEEKVLVPENCENENEDKEKYYAAQGIRNLGQWTGPDDELCSDYKQALKQALLDKLGSQTEVGIDVYVNKVKSRHEVKEWQELSKMNGIFIIRSKVYDLQLENAYVTYTCFIKVTDSSVVTDDKFEKLDRCQNLLLPCNNCNSQIDVVDMADHIYECLEWQRQEPLTMEKLGITPEEVNDIDWDQVVRKYLKLTPEQEELLTPKQLDTLITEQNNFLTRDMILQLRLQ